MPLGTHHELEGMLLRQDGQLFLRVDDGGTWRLDAPFGAEQLVGARVSVAGLRAGFDLLEVETLRRPGDPIPEKRSWWRRGPVTARPSGRGGSRAPRLDRG